MNYSEASFLVSFLQLCFVRVLEVIWLDWCTMPELSPGKPWELVAPPNAMNNETEGRELWSRHEYVCLSQFPPSTNVTRPTCVMPQFAELRLPRCSRAIVEVS